LPAQSRNLGSILLLELSIETQGLSAMLFVPISVCLMTLAYLVPNANAEALPCKVPVFRYALQHWRPDPYEVVILSRDALSEDAESLVAKMKEKLVEPDGFVNLKIVRADVETGETPERLTEALGPDFLDSIRTPEIVLLYPAGSSSGPLAWRGPLTTENVGALFDSPARRQITSWILDGESVVWVLVGSGDSQKDVAAEELLQAETVRLEKEIRMRDIDVIESEKQYSADSQVKLRLGIKLLVLDCTDPREEVFAAMLARSEADLEKLGEPFAIPVFGRGRAHLSLAGKGINPKMIESACRFLIGDCSCEIKRLNPGVDLLFAVNWDKYFVGTAESDEPPGLPGVAEYIPVAPGHDAAQNRGVDVDVLTANEGDAAQTTRFDPSRIVWIFGLIVLGLVVLVSVCLRARTKR
jgi:hypothetical protein